MTYELRRYVNLLTISCCICLVFFLVKMHLFNNNISYTTSKSFYVNNNTYNDSVIDKDWPEHANVKNEDMKELQKAVEEAKTNRYVRSLLVMHKGKMVVEEYYNGCQAEDSNNVHSASKSILSALIGIAIHEGYIDDVNQKISDFLPKSYFEGKNESKKELTIKHLLTMSAGLAWRENNTEYKIEKKEDWIKAIIDKKQIADPGKQFNYSTGLTHIMSAVLTNATGMDLHSFGEKYLFEKLGISVEYWGKDPQGYYSGGCNFFITPRELAKFGQMYLDNGKWESEQIIPQNWVLESFKQWMNTGDDGWQYGFCWWLNEIYGYEIKTAWGYSGQMIHVIPELDLLVVMTTKTSEGSDEAYSFSLLENYIIPVFSRHTFPPAS